MTGVSIRVARRQESDVCVDVFRAAWRGMSFVPQDLHTAAEDQRWMEDVLVRQLVLVAEIPDVEGADDGTGRIVGLLSMSDGTVHNLYILPGHQNRGIGRKLMETAKTCSGGHLQLWVFEPNAGAIRFYEREGFVTVRRTDGRENEEKVPDRLMAWQGDGA